MNPTAELEKRAIKAEQEHEKFVKVHREICNAFRDAQKEIGELISVNAEQENELWERGQTLEKFCNTCVSRNTATCKECSLHEYL